MFIRLSGHTAPPGRAGEKAHLHEIGLIDIFQSDGLLIDGGRQSVQPYRPPAVIFNDAVKHPAIHGIQSQIVHLQGAERFVSHPSGDHAPSLDLSEITDTAKHPVGDPRARVLGLPYPGGPSVANAARTGDPKAYRLPVPHVEGKYNVSFSGLKTAVLNEVNQAQMKGTDINVPDLAASFQERIAGILAEKLLLAAADTGAKQVCLAGGVAANGRLRQLVNDGAQKLGAKIFLPELKYCGDNGAMIAAQGYYEFQDGNLADWSLNGLPTLPIDYR